MAKTLTRIDPELVEVAREQARKLLEEVFTEARNRGAAGTAEGRDSLGKPPRFGALEGAGAAGCGGLTGGVLPP